MMTHVSVKRLRQETIHINCPRCQARGARATCVDQRETLNFILRNTTTWVTCHACGTCLYSKWACEDLVDRAPEELEGIVVQRVSLIRRFLAIAAILLCWMPVMGIVIAAAALTANWRNRRWKTASMVALCISMIPTLFVIIGSMLWK